MTTSRPPPSLLDLVGQIYAAVLDRELWPSVVRDMAETFHSKSALLRLMDRQCEQVSLTLAHGYDERFFVPYREHFIHLDPFNAYLMDKPVGTMCCTPQIMPMSAFTKTEYYADYARPQDIYYAGGGFVLHDDTATAVLGFQRNQAMGAFDPEALGQMALLGVHLQRAFLLSRQLGQVDRQARAFEQLLEQRPFGVVLIDEIGRAVYLNPRAETLIRLHPEIQVVEGRLRLRDHKAGAQLERLVQEVIATSLGRGLSAGGALRLAGDSAAAKSIVLVVTPLRSNAQTGALSGPRWCAAVFLGLPQERRAMDGQVLHSLYGLTPAEARLAVELANGRDLDAVSEALFITKHTARTQLKAIFHKTGCRRQAELVKLLLSLPLVGG